MCWVTQHVNVQQLGNVAAFPRGVVVSEITSKMNYQLVKFLWRLSFFTWIFPLLALKRMLTVFSRNMKLQGSNVQIMINIYVWMISYIIIKNRWTWNCLLQMCFMSYDNDDLQRWKETDKEREKERGRGKSMNHRKFSLILALSLSTTALSSAIVLAARTCRIRSRSLIGVPSVLKRYKALVQLISHVLCFWNIETGCCFHVDGECQGVMLETTHSLFMIYLDTITITSLF